MYTICSVNIEKLEQGLGMKLGSLKNERKKWTYIRDNRRYHSSLHQTFPVKALKPTGKEREREGEGGRGREGGERERERENQCTYHMLG